MKKGGGVDYVELRCRSAYSFLSGASLPEDLVERAAVLDYGVLALGDRDGVYGAPRFHQAAKAAGLRAITGCAITLADRAELYVLVADRTGYRNLCRLLTQSKLRAPKGEAVATWSDVEGHTDGLICLAGGREGPIAAGHEPVEGVIARLQRLFPDRLYIDLQRHLDPEDERLNASLTAVAERFRIPLAASNEIGRAHV